MKKTFEKHETLFCILLIVIYVVINSFCVQLFGYTSCVGFIEEIIFRGFLFKMMEKQSVKIAIHVSATHTATAFIRVANG